MDQNNLISKIFEIENDTKLLDYTTYDGIPIWMIGRYYLLYKTAGGKLLGYESSDRERKVSAKIVAHILKVVMHSLKNRNINKGKEILLYSTNRKTIIHGKYFNRYVDQLYSVYPDSSLVIEQSLLNWEWPFPRVNHTVYFDTIGRIAGEIESRLFYKKDYVEVYRMLEYFNSRLTAICRIKLKEDEIREAAVYISRLIVSMRFQSAWLKSKVTNQTRVVIMVGAGFPFYYFLNRMLKNKNIISVELQHGYITKNNFMYNYAPKIVNDERVKNGLPEYILTYGSWWNEQMNCPMKKISIGNPYREYCKKHITGVNEENNNITVIGTGENTGSYIQLVEYLSNHCTDFHVKYRPHPGELNKIKAMVRNGQNNIELDDGPEIYATLSNTSIIIGEVSTVLFEAIGIVNRIIVWNTTYASAYLPEHPFESFSTYEELKDLLQNDKGTKYADNEFWGKNWKESYQGFIKSIVGLEMSGNQHIRSNNTKMGDMI